MHYITFTADGFASFCGGSRQPSKTLSTCSIGFPTVRLPRVFVTTVPHLVWLIEEPNIDDQGFEKSKMFSWKVCALEVLDICTQTWWALPPALVSLTIFQAAWEAVSNNSCTQAGHVWAASHKHPNQKDKIAPSVRDPEKPALDVWGGAPKLETEGQPSTLKDLNLDAKNFTENWRNKNEWLQNKFKSLMIFPQVMYRTLYLLPGPGYWITVSPTLMLQVILPVGPKIGTAHACFLCKPWMAYVIAKIVFRFSRICLQGPDSFMFHLRRFSTPAYFETNVLKELQIHQKQAVNQWESSRNMSTWWQMVATNHL